MTDQTEEAAQRSAFDALFEDQTLSVAQARELNSMLGVLGDMAREGTAVGDLKIANAALGEMAEAFRVFRPYRHIRKITMFGSARNAAPKTRCTSSLAIWPPSWLRPTGWS